MKTRPCLLSLFPLFVLIAANSMAQGVHNYCGTQEINNAYLKQHPESIELEKMQNEYVHRYTEQVSQDRALVPVYILPVVFHILHQYGTENISDAQVLDAMRIINEDFRKLNADTVNIIPIFKPVAADCEIEFRLATIDPNGNCTNGIDRIVTPLTNIGDNTAKLNQWPRDKYLNVWVTRTISSGANGYTYFPANVTGSNQSLDGIMIKYTYVGSFGTSTPVTSRLLTHEIGHFLNLQHTWGTTSQPGVACGDDGISDTPETKGWLVCNLAGSYCNPPIIENVQNFMEYSTCTCMFTNGQIVKIRASLNLPIFPFRQNLWSASNLAATGALVTPPPVCTPVADFDSIPAQVCAGSSITLHELSWNAAPTGWLWNCPGGNPSSTTLQNPVIQYTTPGTYNVTLIVSTITGSDTLTRNGHVVVNTIPSATITATGLTTFCSGGSVLLSAPVAANKTYKWKLNNNLIPGAVSQTYSAAASGTYKVIVTNNSNGCSKTTPSGTVVTVNALPSATVTPQGPTTFCAGDSVILKANTATGFLWQWKKNNVNILNATNKKYTATTAGNYKVKITNSNGCTKISAAVTVTVPCRESQVPSADDNNTFLYVYPNPSDGTFSLSYLGNKAGNGVAFIQLFNTLGQVIYQVEEPLKNGQIERTISPGTHMEKGIYLLRVVVNDDTHNTRVIIN